MALVSMFVMTTTLGFQYYLGNAHHLCHAHLLPMFRAAVPLYEHLYFCDSFMMQAAESEPSRRHSEILAARTWREHGKGKP